TISDRDWSSDVCSSDLHRGHLEIILVASVDDLPSRSEPPLAGMSLRRGVGACGARLSAVMDDEAVGYIEVEVRTDGDPRTRQFEIGRAAWRGRAGLCGV